MAANTNSTTTAGTTTSNKKVVLEPNWHGLGGSVDAAAELLASCGYPQELGVQLDRGFFSLELGGAVSAEFTKLTVNDKGQYLASGKLSLNVKDGRLRVSGSENGTFSEIRFYNIILPASEVEKNKVELDRRVKYFADNEKVLEELAKLGKWKEYYAKIRSAGSMWLEGMFSFVLGKKAKTPEREAGGTVKSLSVRAIVNPKFTLEFGAGVTQTHVIPAKTEVKPTNQSELNSAIAKFWGSGSPSSVAIEDGSAF